MKKEVSKQLNALRNALKEVNNINSGGCGIAALAMYRLLKNNGEEAQIVYGYDGETGSFYTNKERLNNNGATIAAATHVYLKLGSMYIDCKSYDARKEFMISLEHYVDEKFLVDSINLARWNSSFKRKDVKTVLKNFNIEHSDIRIDNIATQVN